MSLEDLFAAAEDVTALIEHPGWAHVIRLIDAEAESSDRLLDGVLLDSRAAYAHAHGRRGGLRGAQEAADAIVRTAERKLADQREKHERGAGASQGA